MAVYKIKEGGDKISYLKWNLMKCVFHIYEKEEYSYFTFLIFGQLPEFSEARPNCAVFTLCRNMYTLHTLLSNYYRNYLI